MTDLLESVQTAKLQGAFDKYLPAVLAGNTPEKKKATLTEGKEITGNKETTIDSNDAMQNYSNVVDIKRLAGIQ
jgi:hypothetical protein